MIQFHLVHIYIAELKNIAETYGKRLFIIDCYKSWEYLMLKTNLFKNKFKSYSLSEGVFEESYYEQLLQKLSNSRYGTIHHTNGGHDISKCYTDKCCAYKMERSTNCKLGLPGNDKFVSLLKGTEFNILLAIAGRKEE